MHPGWDRYRGMAMVAAPFFCSRSDGRQRRDHPPAEKARRQLDESRQAQKASLRVTGARAKAPFESPPRKRLPCPVATAPKVPEKGSTTHFHGTWAPPPKSESSVSKIFRHSGMTVAFKTTFEVFTRVGPNNSLERLTECSVGLVTDRPSDVYELFVTLL
jgi:hypothetical protein